jgi:hypothetical protein
MSAEILKVNKLESTPELHCGAWARNDEPEGPREHLESFGHAVEAHDGGLSGDECLRVHLGAPGLQD